MERAPLEIVGCQNFNAVRCTPCQFYPICLKAVADALGRFERLMRGEA